MQRFLHLTHLWVVLTGFSLFGSLLAEAPNLSILESGRSSAVERLLAKQKVVGSSPIVRSI
jgi:hypothetical protein